MKTAIIGLKTERVKRVFAKHFIISAKKPDFVVSYGGDGTLLHAERICPGIPKLPLRHYSKCGICAVKRKTSVHEATPGIYCDSALPQIIKLLRSGKFAVKEILKIKATAFAKRGGKTKRFTLTGMNEVQIRNSSHAHAIRFEFCLNGACIEKEIIGDGVVAATTHGSTAYFYAITRKKFVKGFGIAFNNTIREQKPFFLNGKFRAEVRIHRRHASLIADNDPRAISLKEGDRVVIEPAKEKARIIKL